MIDAAAPRTWQAAAWLLERRYPHDYGRRAQDVTVTTYDEPALRVLAAERGPDPDEFVATVARVQQASNGATRRGGAGPGPRPGRT